MNVNAVAASAAIPLNHVSSAGFNATVAVEAGTGDGQWSLQYTLDNIQDSTVTPVWHNHNTLASITGTAVGYIDHPVTAVRVNCTVVDSTSLVLKVLQRV